MDTELEGRWVPGLIHLHSKYSDGRHTIPQLKRWAQQRRYRFMIVTDHAEMMRDTFDDYVAECQRETEAEFIVIPGVEIATGWALPAGQDESTAHTLALDIADAVELFTASGAPLKDWSPRSTRQRGTKFVLRALHDAGVSTAAAHQFQYATVRYSLSEPLAGSDYRYEMGAASATPGIDFYYRTILELDHEPEDLALYTGLVARWMAERGATDPLPMPWAYTGSDFHGGWFGVGRYGSMLRIAVEQLSHATWVYLQSELTKDAILDALRKGRTCATRGRRNIVQANSIEPLPGSTAAASEGSGSPTKITLDVTFPRRTTRPMYAHFYRDGVEASGFTETFDKGDERLIVEWEVQATDASQHAYVGVISGKLVTSPILIRT